MLEITETATEKIAEYFKDKEETSPVRIFLNEIG